MVSFYVNRIKNEKMTLDDVPLKWNKLVKAELDKEI